MAELIYKDEVYAIVGAAMEVYNQLGIDTLTSREESQLINYLKATGLKVGLLINFGSYGKLEWRRLVLTKDGSNRRPPRSTLP
jgi:hypothetical protein